MTANDPATGLVDQDEGLRLRVYDDATGRPIVPGTTVIGNPTIGYGRNLSGNGITLAEAELLRDNDLAAVRAGLSKYPWFTALDDNRRAAIEDMVVNLGLFGFLGFEQTITALLLKRYSDAAADIRNSLAYRQLPARYERIARITETGKI
jgi:lysozyme